jgi:hypothetical protein
MHCDQSHLILNRSIPHHLPDPDLDATVLVLRSQLPTPASTSAPSKHARLHPSASGMLERSHPRVRPRRQQPIHPRVEASARRGEANPSTQASASRREAICAQRSQATNPSVCVASSNPSACVASSNPFALPTPSCTSRKPAAGRSSTMRAQSK